MARTAADEKTSRELDDDARAQLLDIARRSVAAAVRGLPDAAVKSEALAPPLDAPRGAFVTLHLDGRLRGCIGSIAPRGESLAETVASMARAAALEDPRFAPVTEDELPRLDLEISVLGPLVPVSLPDEIVVGRDGLLVEDGVRRGLLLPQVATEWGWDRETLLHQTCVKAGLGADAWRHGAAVYRFTAEVFGLPAS